MLAAVKLELASLFGYEGCHAEYFCTGVGGVEFVYDAE